MRTFALLAIGLLALAGCAGKPTSTATGAATTSATTSHVPPARSINATTALPQPKTGNATKSITTNTTQEKKGVVIDQHFSGMGPVDTTTTQALTVKYALPVPAKVDDLRVIYNATYTGLFSAVVELDNPSGTSVGDSLSTCGANLAPGAQKSFTCEFHVTHPVAGAWTVQYDWQAGETVETYNIDVLGVGTVA